MFELDEAGSHHDEVQRSLDFLNLLAQLDVRYGLLFKKGHVERVLAYLLAKHTVNELDNSRFLLRFGGITFGALIKFSRQFLFFRLDFILTERYFLNNNLGEFL